MDFRTEVYTKTVDKDMMLNGFRMQETVDEACRLCPYYGNVWSCPPGVPDPCEYLRPYSRAVFVCVKVIYDEALRARVDSSAMAEEVRDRSYEEIKKTLLLTLVEYEKFNPGSVSLCAGRCYLCPVCARTEGKPCRFPDKLRYSITSFGFDFAKITDELFGFPLLWSKNGLPEYDVAVAAVFF